MPEHTHTQTQRERERESKTTQYKVYTQSPPSFGISNSLKQNLSITRLGRMEAYMVEHNIQEMAGNSQNTSINSFILALTLDLHKT